MIAADKKAQIVTVSADKYNYVGSSKKNSSTNSQGKRKENARLASITGAGSGVNNTLSSQQSPNRDSYD